MRLTLVLAHLVLSAAVALGGPEQSSCFVQRHFRDGTSDAGTGTVIAAEFGRSLVLTNAHVLESGTGKLTVTLAGKEYPATFLYGSRVSHTGPSLIHVDGPDLALCVVGEELPVAPIAALDPAKGDRVRMWGFGGRLGKDGPKFRSGKAVEGPRFVDPTDLARMGTISGDSGSGWFNDAGELCAVHWGGDGQTAYAVPVRVARPFIRDHAARLFPGLAKRLGK